MSAALKKYFISLLGVGNQGIGEIGFLPFLSVMLVSLISALFISFLYTKFYRCRATGSEIHRAFPLLGVSVTAIFITIQFSLPLSLGLLGALSIVRFRTPIKEPEEIGFIMVVIASSLCCATFNMLFLGIFLITVVAALLILSFTHGFMKGRFNDGMLIITLPEKVYRELGGCCLDLLGRKLPRGRVDSITENEEEAIISYSFLRFENTVLLETQKELKKISPSLMTNIFFNRSGEV